ncbi:putative ATP-dependent RNA helicase TDRD12 [Echeneis naucrates]|uniref:putative ATP-dependent RNA helicase TDRD12 n=1 Tax=Echeneis naucrates TaxID=173247 RepID=UPI00111361C3|nr:putative ATP-dependent RNA helicase TDRD12 [Echeneis naucrates]
MLKISVVKVENPSCLWGRVFLGPGCTPEKTEEYDNLKKQMNLFYCDVTQDQSKLKPTSVEEGQVCVVYWSVMKSWCRAVVEFVIKDSESPKACCHLVDHAERLVVPFDQIRIAVQNFLQLPFAARKFHLAGIKPTTLRVPICEGKAELIPSKHWDSSATFYLHNLLQVSTQAEAVLLESESHSTSIELYLTVRNLKICVNDDLVAKKFAYYSVRSDDNSWMDEVNRSPVMLSSSVLTQTVPSVSNKPPAQTHPPPGISQGVVAGGAGDWLMGPSTPQSLHHELRAGEGDIRSNVKELSPGSQSRNGSDSAAESDFSGDADSSLAAALTKNLSLFKFLNFLNPASSYQKAAHSHEELKEMTAASSTYTGQEVYAANSPSKTHEPVTPEEVVDTSTSVDPEPAGTQETLMSGEDRLCSRFLEWLNPGILNLDSDAGDDTNVPSDPSRTGILLHSALPVEPWSSLEDAPISNALRLVLRSRQYGALTPADRYSWPAVTRGCNTLFIAHNADQPLSYLTPLLTHIQLNSIFCSHTSSSGPIAVLLCAGWERVQLVSDLLEESKIARNLHPVSVLLGAGNDQAKTFRIPKNCLLLMTTPFSLVRLLSCHCFMFLRLYHLVLDGADQLFTLAPEQMVTILQHFQKVTSREENASCPQQLVAVAKKWTNHMEGLLTNHMPYPSIIMTVPEEAALYGNVQQIILMTLESSKISELLSVLDFNPVVGQKTLIITNSAQEVEDVFKAVSSRSAFCLMAHEGLTHQFDHVSQQWRKEIGPGTHILLGITSECLQCFDIRDATCVVHYSFPTSPKQFGSRLFCMANNFRNLTERNQTDSCLPVIRSVLLISERNSRHVLGVLRYLRRTDALLPPELLSFARGIQDAQEDQKTSQPFCSYLKSFGVCRDSSVCPDRHKFISHLDQSELPASGIIEAVPLYIKTASVFYGRIIRRDDSSYDDLMSEMASYYAEKKPGPKEVLEGGLYTVQEDSAFHRVKVLSVPIRDGCLFFKVFVRFIDVGKEEEVKSHQILQLPEQFHSLPGQAVEIIVCQVKPVDAEIDWHPKVTRAVTQKIRGLQHRARAVLSLGNTVFVDPMVRMTQMPGMKTVINEYSVQSEILSTGMGASNPEHLDLLRALCQEREADAGQDGGGSSEWVRSGRNTGLKQPVVVCRSEAHSVSLDVVIKAELEGQPEASKAAEVRKLAGPPPLKSLSPDSSLNRSLVPVRDPDEQRNNHCTDGRIRGGELHLSDGLPSCDCGDDESSSTQVDVGINHHDSTKSFHPQVRWYQTSDSVTVTVKLINPEGQRCDFFPSRVVYSGRVGGRFYRADLELRASVDTDRCCWEVKSNEPVLKLVKQQQGYWDKLTLNKNIFVSYNLEHFEEDEDTTSHGQWFVERTGEDHWEDYSYVNCESDTDSD